jgi:hypothetical protein
METQTTTHRTVEYTPTPWYLRISWWIAAHVWCWGRNFEELSIDSPEMANPFWRRW